MSNDSTYTFWKLLGQYHIHIPKLQRNYVQGELLPNKGRESTEIRLTGMRLIDRVLESVIGEKPLELDFIYGTITVTTSDSHPNIVYPLDGQQRLTLLWLIHWYIGTYKDGGLHDEEIERLAKFSYSTRTTSRLFIEQLVRRFKPDTSPDAAPLRKQIEECNWFYTKWLFDPTINSMLNVLEHSLEKKLKGCTFSELWTKLTGDACHITFQWKDIGVFSHADDLYIKMNGRGRLLESLGNFRADLVETYKDEDSLWVGKLMAKFQGPWTELFWDKLTQENKNKLYDPPEDASQKFSIETSLYELMSRFFLCYRCIHTETEQNNFALIYDFSDKNLEYTRLEVFTPDMAQLKIMLKSFERLMEKVLLIETAPGETRMRLNELSSPPWANATLCNVLPDPNMTVGKKANSITLKNMVVFYAVVKYLLDVPSLPEENTPLWLAWMRLIWNIVENSTVSLSHLKLVEELGNKLLPHPDSFYHELANLSLESRSAETQMREEKEKAYFRCENPEMRDILERIDHEFLGQIYPFYKEKAEQETPIDKQIFTLRLAYWYDFSSLSPLEQAKRLLCCYSSLELLANNTPKKKGFPFPNQQSKPFYTGKLIKDYIAPDVFQNLLEGRKHDPDRYIFRDLLAPDGALLHAITCKTSTTPPFFSMKDTWRIHRYNDGRNGGGGRLPLDDDSVKVGKIIQELQNYDRKWHNSSHNTLAKGYIWYKLRGWFTPLGENGSVNFHRWPPRFLHRNTKQEEVLPDKVRVWSPNEGIEELSRMLDDLEKKDIDCVNLRMEDE